MVHMSYVSRPKLPQKLLVIMVTLLHSHRYTDMPVIADVIILVLAKNDASRFQEFIQGMAKSCHGCTHPWETARMGLDSVLDCCGRQIAIPETAGCCLLRAPGDVWLALQS